MLASLNHPNIAAIHGIEQGAITYRESELLDGGSGPRIPYILTMAGQKTGALMSHEFNAVVTQSLLLDILRGKAATPERAA